MSGGGLDDRATTRDAGRIFEYGRRGQINVRRGGSKGRRNVDGEGMSQRTLVAAVCGETA